jgi:hypothetical protein
VAGAGGGSRWMKQVDEAGGGSRREETSAMWVGRGDFVVKLKKTQEVKGQGVERQTPSHASLSHSPVSAPAHTTPAGRQGKQARQEGRQARQAGKAGSEQAEREGKPAPTLQGAGALDRHIDLVEAV